MPITLNQHRQGLTQALVDTFSDAVDVKDGFAAFFPTKTTTSKNISIEVQRNGKPIAVDVLRCTDPIRNTFDKSTEKIFTPPYFHEMFDFTSCDAYDVTFGRGVGPDGMAMADLFNSANDKLMALKNKIKRAIQLQYSQVLQTGIVTLNSGDNIDFKRKAESMVVKTVAAEKWTAPTTSDPITDLKAGCEFLRSVGKSGSSTINAIMGSAAFTNFKTSTKVQNEADLRNINRIDLGMPQFDNVSGLVFQGQVGAGDFIVNLWTYNETYEDAAGVEQRFLGTNNVVLLPDDFRGVTAFAGLPAVMGDPISGQFIGIQEAEFLMYDVIDQIKRSWNFMVDSAPLVVPVSIDRIYTLQTTS